jgi:probable F420-dependent oxidoreductase
MPYSGVVMLGQNIHKLVELAKLGEALGYRDAWVTEVGGPDAVSVVAAAAVATSRIRLATGITATYTRSPYLMAMTANTLQDLSGGRFVAGLGTSTAAIVSGWHGLPWEKPLRHTREYVDLLRRLSAGERVKHEGMFTIRGASLRPASTPVPIYLAALNPGMLELAGEIADGVILNFPTLSYASRAVEHIESGIKKAGRDRGDVDIVAFMRTAITDDFDAGAAVLRRELLTYFLAPVYQRVFTDDGYGEDTEAVKAAWAAGDRAGAVTKIADRTVDDHAVIGPADACRAKAQALLDAGIDRAILFPVAPEGTDRESQILHTVRALAPSKV